MMCGRFSVDNRANADLRPTKNVAAMGMVASLKSIYVPAMLCKYVW